MCYWRLAVRCLSNLVLGLRHSPTSEIYFIAQSFPDSPATFPSFITRLFHPSSPGPCAVASGRAFAHGPRHTHGAGHKAPLDIKPRPPLSAAPILKCRSCWKHWPHDQKGTGTRQLSFFLGGTRQNSSCATTGVHPSAFPGIVLNFRKSLIFWFCAGTPAMFRKKDPERVPLLSDGKNAANGVIR